MLGWSEDDSVVYRRLAPVAVPRRAEQLATISTLLPFAGGHARIVELGCGEGALAPLTLQFRFRLAARGW